MPILYLVIPANTRYQFYHLNYCTYFSLKRRRMFLLFIDMFFLHRGHTRRTLRKSTWLSDPNFTFSLSIFLCVLSSLIFHASFSNILFLSQSLFLILGLVLLPWASFVALFNLHICLFFFISHQQFSFRLLTTISL